MYEAQMRWPGDRGHPDEPDAEHDQDGDADHGDDDAEDDGRAATMAGRTARSLTVATTVSIVSRARADSASERSFSATA